MSETENMQDVLPMEIQTAVQLKASTEQLGAYLVKMAQILTTTQQRLDEMERRQREITISHEETKRITALIRERAREYCEKYELTDPKDATAIRSAIRRAVMLKCGVKDLHDIPQIALESVVRNIERWVDIRLAMKLREQHRERGA